MTCTCVGRSGIVYKPSGRVVCGDCGGDLVNEQPPKQARP